MYKRTVAFLRQSFCFLQSAIKRRYMQGYLHLFFAYLTFYKKIFLGYFLFLFYLFLLSWLLTRIRFIQKAGLQNGVIAGLFLLKVLAGVISGWMLRNDLNADTWGYHKDALVEYHLLFSNPSEYFSNLFYTGYQYGYDGVLQFHNSYWNDLKTTLMVKFVSVLHLFSFGHYYVNVVLYNFLVFFGHIALFRLFKNAFADKKKSIVAGVFLLPSLLLFSSMLHKEGLIFAAVSITCYCFYNAAHLNGFTLKRITIIILCLLFIFFLRSYIFLGLFPCLLAWYITIKSKYKVKWVFTLVLLTGLLAFFIIPHFLPAINPPQLFVDKQADFFSLGKANSSIRLDTLSPGFKSFAANLPQAAGHIFLRPWFVDYFLSHPLLPFIVELLLYQALFILWIFFNEKGSKNKALVVFSVSFSLIILLMIGYTIPVLWAIVRYRSIYLPFLLTPLICSISYQKVLLFFKMTK